MILSRRLFVAGCACLPAFTALKAVPVLAMPPVAPACVGEVWGMPFWASGAEPAAITSRRKPSLPPAWHPEFS